MKVQEYPSTNLLYQDLSLVFLSSSHFNSNECMSDEKRFENTKQNTSDNIIQTLEQPLLFGSVIFRSCLLRILRFKMHD